MTGRWIIIITTIIIVFRIMIIIVIINIIAIMVIIIITINIIIIMFIINIIQRLADLVNPKWQPASSGQRETSSLLTLKGSSLSFYVYPVCWWICWSCYSFIVFVDGFVDVFVNCEKELYCSADIDMLTLLTLLTLSKTANSSDMEIQFDIGHHFQFECLRH